jgi:tetratricopeptide (TPR) repeat protein/tRNA A-37 threonylcarbamoyl transferase component Bud32
MTTPTPGTPRPEDRSPSDPTLDDPIPPPVGMPLTLTQPLGPSTGPLAELPPHPQLLSPASEAREVRSGGASRYRALRPLGKGGLGEVFVALDEELNREVALKEIQAQHQGSGDNLARFLLEAEVTGRLEHPGVVPVYGLGRYPDGRPFYAMRLIKGETLKEAIERFHKADAPSRDPGERSLALRELLRRFIDVCNAVAYAHSKGVLHRDLKPANVMLGPFGETLVIDWGLAKILGRPTTDSTDGVSLVRGMQTASLGSTGLAGTPGYLSPEQSEGRTGELTPASDVYSLGAILYELLTGQGAFKGGGLEQVLSRQRRGVFTAPRRVKASVPAALEAVCLKALALQPENRYASARGLAADVDHWLGDEPVTACREPVTVRLRRWGRRHRATVSGLVALLASLTVALAVGLAFVNAEEAKTRAALAQVQNEQKKTAQALADKEIEATRARAAERERRIELGRTSAAAALLSAQRGQWDDALKNYRQALALEPDDEIALRLGMLECHMARYDYGAFREELARLVARNDLGKHRAEVRLQQALDALYSARKDANPTALVLEAIDLGLPPEEDAFAHALIAPTVPQAVDQLQRAARLAPFHRRTHEMLPGMLFLLGRLPEMREAVSWLQLIAPNSVSAGMWQGYIFVLDDNLEAAYAECQRMRPRLGDDGVVVMRLLMRLMHTMSHTEMAWQPDEKRFAIVGELLSAAPQVARMMQDSKDSEGRERWGDFAMYRLPCLQPIADNPLFKGSGTVAQIMALIEPKAMIEVTTRYVQTCPNGMWMHMQSTWLRSEGRLAEAENALSRALRAPSPFPIYRVALADLTAMQFERLSREPPASQPKLKETIRTNLHELAGRGTYPPLVSEHLATIARGVDEPALALFFSEAYVRRAPNDATALESRFLSESALGALGHAVNTNRELLARKPDDANLVNQRVVLEYRQGFFGNAAASSFEVLRLDPKQPNAMGNLATIESELQRRMAVYNVVLEKLRMRPAVILAHQGRHAEAAKAVANEKPDGHVAPALACLHALASAAASKDEKLTPEERGKQAEEHAARAVELLRGAHKAAYFKDANRVKYLDAEHDLDGLRMRDDFKALMDEIKKSG